MKLAMSILYLRIAIAMFKYYSAGMIYLIHINNHSHKNVQNFLQICIILSLNRYHYDHADRSRIARR